MKSGETVEVRTMYKNMKPVEKLDLELLHKNALQHVVIFQFPFSWIGSSLQSSTQLLSIRLSLSGPVLIILQTFPKHLLLEFGLNPTHLSKPQISLPSKHVTLFPIFTGGTTKPEEIITQNVRIINITAVIFDT